MKNFDSSPFVQSVSDWQKDIIDGEKILQITLRSFLE